MADTLENGHNYGRKISWIAVGVIMLGFVAGGVGLTLGPTWWLFWAGGGAVVVGGIVALAANIFADVILDTPRVVTDAAHPAPARETAGERLPAEQHPTAS